MSDQNKQIKPLTIWTPFLLSLVMVTGMVIGRKMEKSVTPVLSNPEIAEMPKSIKASGKNRVEEILNYLEAKYVDDLDRSELELKAIQAILEDLDPHTVYLDADILQRANEDLEGSFNGIGVEFLMLNDTITITQVMDESPAKEAGLKVGENILMIGDSVVHGLSLETYDIVRMLKGERASEVDLSILDQNDSLRELSLKRNKIKISSIDASFMLTDEVGYIKINRFNANVYKEFMHALEILVEEEELKDLVIDVRDNPGGYLKQTVKILSQLFDSKDKLLVYTNGRASRKEKHKTTGNSFYDIGRVVVLINENSASASEILAGSVQDWDRGLIVGDRSFGKGLVQEQYRLSDGSAIRITIARYYTPSGRLIQKPYEEVEEATIALDQSSEMDITRVDTTRFFTSKGREVFAAGGITPDIFVKEEYPDLTKYGVNFLNISSFVLDFFIENKSELPSTVESLYKSDWSDRLLNDYLRSQYVGNNLASMSRKEREHLQERMMVRLTKYHFGLEKSYEYAHYLDPVISTALSEISKNRPIAEYKEN